MSADGSLVVAAGEETVYAFSPSAASLPVPRNTVHGTTTGPLTANMAIQELVPEKAGTQEPEMSVSATQAVPAAPVTYSVISTPTQSPVSPLLLLPGILGAAAVFLRRR
jgi:hypothetical protein